MTDLYGLLQLSLKYCNVRFYFSPANWLKIFQIHLKFYIGELLINNPLSFDVLFCIPES
jgi:hypothetical protein